jgi:polysaccharide export outer membrane protein
VTVYNVEDMDKTVIVDPTGNITLPVLDKVNVEGRTVTEFQRDLEQRLKEFIREPQVGIQVLEYGSRYVNVLGEVGTSGRIAIKGALRVLDAVSQAGGFTEKSGDIELQRRSPEGEVKSRLIPRESLLTGDKATFNIFVHDQDVLNVRPIKSVYVSGEVKSPGSFPYSKDMTLLRAVAKAGGFGQWARKGKVDLLRERPDGSTETLHVDADDIEKGKIPDLPLQPNDHVVVRERKLF